MWENIKKAAKFVWAEGRAFFIWLGRALGLVPSQNAVLRNIRALNTDTENHHLIAMDSQHTTLLGAFLAPPDAGAVDAASKYNHRLFHANRMVTALLSYVAQGNQEKVEQMPRLEFLLGKANVTDYSGRRFIGITPYQYALWALDRHMARTIEEKARSPEGIAIGLGAKLLKQRQELKRKGLTYELNGKFYRDSAYDPKDLYAAYEYFIANSEVWLANGQWNEIDKAWYAVGAQQRLMPAHAIQEMCTPERSFYPIPTLEGLVLRRTFNIYNFRKGELGRVFPLRESVKDGLGINFAIFRGKEMWARPTSLRAGHRECPRMDIAHYDLIALKALFKYRADELSLLPDLTPRSDAEKPFLVAIL